MRNLIIGVLVIFFLAVAGFVGYRFVSRQNQTSDATQSQTTTLTGMLLPGKGDDYSYVLFTKGKTVGIASQKIPLENYANKKVEITGSYSGTTLYAYTINEIK